MSLKFQMKSSPALIVGLLVLEVFRVSPSAHAEEPRGAACAEVVQGAHSDSEIRNLAEKLESRARTQKTWANRGIVGGLGAIAAGMAALSSPLGLIGAVLVPSGAVVAASGGLLEITGSRNQFRADCLKNALGTHRNSNFAAFRENSVAQNSAKVLAVMSSGAFRTTNDPAVSALGSAGR